MLKDNLKRLRQVAGFTQASLADAMKVSLRNVQNWEQGHREPALTALRQLGAALGVSLDELVAEPVKEPPAKKKREGK